MPHSISAPKPQVPAPRRGAVVLTMSLAALMFAGAESVGDSPGASPRVTALSPRGEVEAADFRAGIKLIFDRPVVGQDEVGKPPREPLIQITPPVPGAARWLDRASYVFVPSGAPRPATRYRVMPAPALAKRGVSWAGGELVVDRLRLEDVDFGRHGSRFQALLPTLTLRFSQPVLAAEVLRACSFKGGWGGIAAQLAAEVAAAGARQIKLRPSRQLALATEYALVCSEGLLPAEGDAGLEGGRTEFSTHGALALESFEPTGKTVLADRVELALVFTTPVEPEQMRAHVALRDDRGKAVEATFGPDHGRGTSFTWRGALTPRTNYTLTVGAALTDVFGQKLGKTVTHRLKVGDAEPRLRMERGLFTQERSRARFAAWTRNVKNLSLSCAQIPETKLAALLTGPLNYDSWYDAGDAKPIDFLKLGAKAIRKTVAIDAPRNTWYDAGVDLPATCGGGPSGVYVIEYATRDIPAERWARPNRALANLTDLGLFAKVGDTSSLVWVVRLSNGEPVPGAAVVLRDLTGKIRFQGNTGVDGILRAPGVATLFARDKGKTKPRQNAGDEVELEDEGFGRGRRVLVTAKLADDLAVLDTNWNNGVQIWNFGVPSDRTPSRTQVRGFLQSDRGLYRPGDTVHLRGLARVIDGVGRMRPPSRAAGGAGVKLVVRNPRGVPILDESRPLSAFGGFFRDLSIDPEAMLGDYSVTATLLDQTFSDSFAVEEYRARTFEVKVKSSAEHIVRRAPASFSISARYLYGAPMAGRAVDWEIRRRDHRPIFPGHEQYNFQDLDGLYDEGHYWADEDEERSFSNPIADGRLTLDDQGLAKLALPKDAEEPKGPVQYILAAKVEDASGQMVSAGEVITRHRSDLYVGLHPSEHVQAVDMPFGVQAIAVTPDGKRRAGSAKLTLVRRPYDCSRWGEPCTRKDLAPSITRAVEIPAGSAAVERVVLHEPGEYVVSLESDDGKGGRTRVSDRIYVVGRGEAFWSGDEGDRMTLVASKAKYQAGETARLVPQANLAGALSLLTLERGGIMSYEVRRLATTSEALEVPLTTRHAPNVFASVALVRGRVGEGNQGRPRFKMGIVNLQVGNEQRRLRVEIKTDKPSYEPGEQVTARVRVLSEGKPVKAELAVAAADEGVLQIANYRTPDPMKSFYAPYGLGVESSTTWNRLTRLLDPNGKEDDDGEGGDEAGSEGGRVRSRFMPTAYWNPALVTSANGTAKITFQAPDNLTAFRVMAVAADVGDRFGAGEQRFTVKKDLLVLPALPRFVNVGDSFEAAAVVHNNTKGALRIDVSVKGEGVPLEGVRTIDVASGAAVRVAVPTTGVVEGSAPLAKVRIAARAGSLGDAVEVTLPIQRPVAREALSIGEGVAQGRVELDVSPPIDALAGESRLEVTVDVLGLARLAEGLRYLVQYPYGCLEQTTSKVVPMLALKRFGSLLAQLDEGERLDAAQLDRFVRAGIAKILRHQHDDGGFGLWMGSAPELHYTVIALFGLDVARRAGLPIPEDAIRRGVAYLRRGLAEQAHEVDKVLALQGGTLGERAFALHLLTRLTAPDDATEQARLRSLAQALFEQRAALPREGQTYLLRALHAQGQQDSARRVLADLEAAVPGTKGPVVIGEGAGTRLEHYFHTDVRTTALALEALVEVAPDHPLIPRLADGLFARREEGRWSNTQENMHALLALGELASRRSAAEVRAQIRLGDQPLFAGTLGGAEVRRFSVPAPGAGKVVKLVLMGEGAGFSYQAQLRVVRRIPAVGRSAGLQVTRRYLDPASGALLAPASIKLGQVVKVEVNLTSAKRLSHVALVDALPAGFEPVFDRFTRPPQPRRIRWWDEAPTTWQFRQLRDDRAELFADTVAPGTSTQTYLARATAAGTFAAPGTHAHAMYRPAVSGRGDLTRVIITP